MSQTFSSQCFPSPVTQKIELSNIKKCFLISIYVFFSMSFLLIYLFSVPFTDPTTNPAYSEERLAHEALQLEKRLSLLSHTSRQGSGGKKFL